MTFLPRKLTTARRGLAHLAIAAVLMLGGCESSTVPNGDADTQAGSIFPPGVIPDIDAYFPGMNLPGGAPNPGTPNVGLLLPLTGQHARIGKTLLNAAQLALFDIAGNDFTLIVRDTKGTEAGARMAAQSALNAGSSIILGPLFANLVPVVAELALPRGVNVVAFSNDVSVAGDGVYIMGLAPGPQVRRVVGYAAAQGLGQFALFFPNNGYGRAVFSSIQEAVIASDRTVARIVGYDPVLEDPSVQVRSLADYDNRHEDLLEAREKLEGRTDGASIKELKRLETLDTLGSPPFDAVMLPMGGKTLMTMAPLLAFFDVDPAEVQFLGTALWDDPRLGSEVTLRGGWFAAPSPALWQEFAGRYQEVFSERPARIASLAYDGTALAAVLSRGRPETGNTPNFTAAAIAQPSGFAGIDGIFRFQPNGQIERGLAVLEMGEKGLTVLDPAPATFERLIN